MEVDEAYLGGLEKKKHKSQKARVLQVESPDAQILHWIILKNVAEGAKTYTVMITGDMPALKSTDSSMKQYIIQSESM
ncbi:MAG: hypothetical protein OXC97_01500 [Candidatus Dadabacteria bacterium]|nr:hypothetical protein [Candidatus Dadabacteria bacterium]